MSYTLYKHPDGFTLAFKDNVLTATDDDGKSVPIPIGPLGLVEVADKLKAIGLELCKMMAAVTRLLLHVWCAAPARWLPLWRAAK
jgi:hypothetical protein